MAAQKKMTLKEQAELRREVKRLQSLVDNPVQTAGDNSVDNSEIANQLKDAGYMLEEANKAITVLESNLKKALAGGDHAQAADLPAVAEDRERFFVDLTKLHAEYLRRAAAREGRQVPNMIERIIRIDWAASPDKGGALRLGAETGTSMPASDAPQIPITG